MGLALIRLISDIKGVCLHAALEQAGSDRIGSDAGPAAGLDETGIRIGADMDESLAGADAVIDFTRPDASVSLAGYAARHGVAQIIGTTGFDKNQEAAIRVAAQSVAIVKAGNMSLGVNLLAGLVEQAAAALNAADFDIEIVEMHHRHKVDAPSGTALLLGEAAASGRKVDLDDVKITVRDGHTGSRQDGAIGFATLRGGSVIGDHTVMMAGEGEILEFSHRAGDRGIFARGAIKAAIWANSAAPGLYSMQDVLGLKPSR